MNYNSKNLKINLDKTNNNNNSETYINSNNNINK